MRLDRVHVPEALDAEERAWRMLRGAYEARPPTRRGVPVRALVLAGAALALVAAAVTPPGQAVLGSVRKAIGKEQAASALTRLPAGGKLIVDSSAGPWIVSPDGSKRLLGDFSRAAWSPHGLYVVATGPKQLAAVEPGGRIHWSLARGDVRLARWGGSRLDTRIAYLSRGRLRVVAGDGTGDVPACGGREAAPVAPAWQPGAGHVVAFADPRGRIGVLDVDRCVLVWKSAPIAGARSLAWSQDGRRLLVVSRAGLTVYGAASPRPLSVRRLPRIAAAAFAPRSHRVAVVRAQEVLVLDADRLSRSPRRLFAGAGGFTDLAWSPDGRWLLVAWENADQWLFLRTSGRRVLAVGSIAEQFGGGSFPHLGGWCCAS